MTHSYQIEGMTCNSCVAKVKSELLKLGDITSADVQLAVPQAVISMSKHISTEILQQAVSRAGHYTLTESANGTAMAVHSGDAADTEKASYFPIFLLFGYITGVTVLIQIFKGSFSWMQWMGHFMGGFFLMFSFFKLMNLRGFSEGYQSYDIVAKKVPAWGFIYPFAELLLGILFLSGFFALGTNIATFVIMSVSSIGVIQSLLRKQQFQCACLGTVIKLPLSKVTLFEDLLMVFMSAIMIITLL
jgi:copper chaperone CopZ